MEGTLTNQIFALTAGAAIPGLTALLEKLGVTITPEELRRRLWPEDTFVRFRAWAKISPLRGCGRRSVTQPRTPDISRL